MLDIEDTKGNAEKSSDASENALMITNALLLLPTNQKINSEDYENFIIDYAALDALTNIRHKVLTTN